MQSKFLEICPTSYHRLAEDSMHVWGWEIVVYLFLGGVVAGLMIWTAALELRFRGKKNGSGGRGELSDGPPYRSEPSEAVSFERSKALTWMPLIALGLLSVGMVALFLDLNYKIHSYRFYLAFKPSSPMSWGGWILLVIYPSAGLMWLGSVGKAMHERLCAMKPVKTLRLSGLLDWAIGIAAKHRQTVLWVNITAGAGLGVYTGLLLGTMVARIQWNSAVLGPLFLSSGLSTGAAFMLLFPLHKYEQHALVRWDIVAIVAEIFFIGLMVISFAGGNATAQLAAENLLGGKWTALFWTLVVVMGLIVPLVMEIFEIRRKLRLALLTPVLILAGGIALRAILLASGQESCFCALG